MSNTLVLYSSTQTFSLYTPSIFVWQSVPKIIKESLLTKHLLKYDFTAKCEKDREKK